MEETRGRDEVSGPRAQEMMAKIEKPHWRINLKGKGWESQREEEDSLVQESSEDVVA